jgi:carbon storage regulator
MLVLSRKRDEQIVIGDGIIVTVVEIRGDKVRLGVEAPLDVSVHRQEVMLAIKKAEQARSSIQPSSIQPANTPSETADSTSPSK